MSCDAGTFTHKALTLLTEAMKKVQARFAKRFKPEENGRACDYRATDSSEEVACRRHQTQ